MQTLIIIPCYNEEHRIDRAAFEAFLQAGNSVGLIFVNDGSTDGTSAVLHDIEARWTPRVTVLELTNNRGKAEAVRQGLLMALSLPQAEYVGYFDADLATPLSAISDFVHTLTVRKDISFVVGARVALLGRRIKRKAYRHYLGRIFATAASLVLRLPIYDTQCGAKLFRVTPALTDLLSSPFGSRWIFDVELIARFLQRNGSSNGIFELPLAEWMDVGGSRVRGMDFLRAIGELSAIYRRYFLQQDRRRLTAWLTSPLVLYMFAGTIGTVLHYATLAACVELAHAAAERGTILGAAVGAAVNYVLNYHITFASHRPHRAALPRFLVVATMGAALNGGGMWLLSRRLHLHYLLAQLVCTLVVLAVGFVVNRAWTFGSARKHDRGT